MIYIGYLLKNIEVLSLFCFFVLVKFDGIVIIIFLILIFLVFLGVENI